MLTADQLVTSSNPIFSIEATPTTLIEDEGTITTFTIRLISGSIPSGGVDITIGSGVARSLGQFDILPPAPNAIFTGGRFVRGLTDNSGFVFKVEQNIATISLPIYDDPDLPPSDPNYTINDDIGLVNLTFTLADGTNYDVSPSANSVTLRLADTRTQLPPTSGDDSLVGTSGNDTINGKAGNDTIDGSSGKDYLIGSSGKDYLIGGSGNDRLVGGSGNDTLTGGIGADRFTFNNPNEKTDIITDFSVVDDTIAISNAGFGNQFVSNSSIGASRFFIGSAATTANQRFIYNSTKGFLFYDSDGIGAADPIKIATLSTGLAMTHNDIFVIA
ncbi:hypothetical protein C7H19_11210 [Aphanothece hegewaldii CCALA 016]|uniref:Calcium-binding protein n=1 Tax=Aphanothece hegewaldii CCALA 016 TaxID=2107694 RepID=A0A2T1LY14_9CHRO|nr:calcium-binding protein [Aphanothece hegewaldii]PSF37278.1 hypothetical protein C7H19_11210 [Aphanothece hegewaldii CCALA 016]